MLSKQLSCRKLSGARYRFFRSIPPPSLHHLLYLELITPTIKKENKFPFSRFFLPSPFHSGSPVQLEGSLYLLVNILSQQDRPAPVKTDAPDVTANDILPQIIYMQQNNP